MKKKFNRTTNSIKSIIHWAHFSVDLFTFLLYYRMIFCSLFFLFHFLCSLYFYRVIVAWSLIFQLVLLVKWFFQSTSPNGMTHIKCEHFSLSMSIMRHTDWHIVHSNSNSNRKKKIKIPLEWAKRLPNIISIVDKCTNGTGAKIYI